MKPITITQTNVPKKIQQFNLVHLSTNRAPIKEIGWSDIKVDEEFYNKSIDQIVEIVGGRETTKAKVKFVLRNSPIHEWFADRFIYFPDRKIWSYAAGQDYPSEIKEIRRILTKKY